MESFYGTRNFVALYLSAVLSTLGWAAIDTFLGHRLHAPSWRLRGDHGRRGGLRDVLLSHREILLFFVLPVQMWLLVVIYLAHDAYQLLAQPGSDVAVASHLSGAAFGYLFKHFDLRWSRFSVATCHPVPRLRLISPEPRDRPTTRSAGPTWSPIPRRRSNRDDHHAARRAPRRQTRRGATPQDRTRRARRTDRGREPSAPRSEPTGPESTERPDLMSANAPSLLIPARGSRPIATRSSPSISASLARPRGNPSTVPY